MALVSYSPSIGFLSGKAGGGVFRHSSNYDSLAVYRKGCRPRTNLTSKVTSDLTIALILWQNLSEADKEAWATAATRHPRTNRAGQTYYLSGYQFFMSSNLKLLNAGETPVEDGDIDKLIDPDTYTDLLGADPDSEMIARFNSEGTAADQVMLFYASAPQLSGRLSSFRGGYRFVGQYTLFTGYQVNVIGDYKEAWPGVIIHNGNWVYTYCTFMTVSSGRTTPPQYQSVLYPTS